MIERKKIENRKKSTFVDFERIVKIIDWTKDVSRKDIVKAVNEEYGLTGREKYVANSSAALKMLQKFSKLPCIETRRVGKDCFYTNTSVKKEDIVVAKEGEKLFKDFYTMPEAVEEVKKRREKFPDDDSLIKGKFLLENLIREKSGQMATSVLKALREKEHPEWPHQRSIEGKSMTLGQEVKKLLDFLYLSSEFLDVHRKYILWKGTKDELLIAVNRIRLMRDEPKLDLEEEKPAVKVEEEKPEPVIEEKKEVVVPSVKVVETKPEIKEEPKPETKISGEEKKKRPRIVKTSAHLGASKYESVSSSIRPNESIKIKWLKCLIGESIDGLIPGTYCGYNDLIADVKKTRFVDLQKDAKELIIDINEQFPGIFRSVDSNGFIVGSVYKVAEFAKTYRAGSISQTIYLRLNQSLHELEMMYPDLDIAIAAPINDNCNDYAIVVNRTIDCERAFAQLIHSMRPSEAIFAEESNWTIRRARTIIEKVAVDIYQR